MVVVDLHMKKILLLNNHYNFNHYNYDNDNVLIIIHHHICWNSADEPG